MEWRNLHPGYVHFSPFWSVAEAVVLLSDVRALFALEPWLAARLPGWFTADFSLAISSLRSLMIAVFEDTEFCSCGVFGYATADTVGGAVEDTPLALFASCLLARMRAS